MAQWYYNLNGSMQGPCAQKEVQKLITQGVLTPRDLVYREGEEGWREVRTFGELDLRQSVDLQRQGFGDLPHPQWSIKEGEWLLLVRKQSQGGTEFVQMGPFSMDEVRLKVANREVSPSDHVWRKGMGRWLRLGWIPEFDRREARKKRRAKMRWLVAAFAVGAISVLLFWEARLSRRADAPIQERVAVPAPPVEMIEPSSPPAQEPKKHVREKPVERLPKMALSDEGEGLLILRANDAVSRKVTVIFAGGVGEIVSQKSFYRRFELVRKGAHHPIDLKKMGVPRGKISVSVHADGKTVRRTVFFGDRKTFRAELVQYMKESSYLVQIEKEELLGYLSRHIGLLGELQGKGKIPSPWKSRWYKEDSGRLKGFSIRSRNHYYFADHWAELKKIRQEIYRDLTGQKGALKPERVAWAENLVRGLFEQVQMRSLWKEVTSLNL